jgi:hypothetical protein
MFTLKDIEGALVTPGTWGAPDNFSEIQQALFEQAHEQASISFRLNRERTLAALMSVNSEGHNLVGYQKFALALADAIIAADKEIVELDNHDHQKD